MVGAAMVVIVRGAAMVVIVRGAAMVVIVVGAMVAYVAVPNVVGAPLEEKMWMLRMSLPQLVQPLREP